MEKVDAMQPEKKVLRPRYKIAVKNVTKTVVKGTVLVLILQIKLQPTSCQYPSINYSDLTNP